MREWGGVSSVGVRLLDQGSLGSTILKIPLVVPQSSESFWGNRSNREKANCVREKWGHCFTGPE